MKVLYVVTSMAQGGAERTVLDLLIHLNPHLDQHLAIIYPETLYSFFYKAEIQAHHIPVTFLNKPLGKLGRFIMAWRYWRLIQQYKPDIVVGVHTQAMDFVKWFHCFIPVLAVITVWQGTIQHEADFERERRLLPYVNRIIVVSQAICESLVTHIPESKERVVVIENAANFENFRPGDRPAARATLQLPSHAQIALVAGRYDLVKNHQGLFQAVSQLVKAKQWPSDAHIVCVGRISDPEYFDNLQRYLKQENLEQIVALHPASHQMPHYYQACDFLLLPSLHEGLPLVVIEAAGCQRPALVSEPANASQIVQAEQTGWTVPLSQLADGLVKVFSLSPEIRDMIGKNAYDFVIERYSAAQMADKYLAEYKNVIK